MRFKAKCEVQQGDIRQKTKFLWFPLKLRIPGMLYDTYQTRWLETAKICQIARYTPFGNIYWCNDTWWSCIYE